MAKELKTRGDLHNMVVVEALKSGTCAELPEILIIGPFPSRELTWDFMKKPGSAAVSADCISEIQKIVRRLQQMYELSGD